jgi:hypothetical protein
MFLRLLLAVLMLTGPVPVRVCTCAASVSPVVPAEEPAPEQPLPEAKSCGCGHRANQGETHAATPDSARPDGSVSESGASGHSHPERHDRDCPAVKPRVTVSEAVHSPAPDAPSDFGFSLPLPPETPVVRRKVCSPREAPLGPPSVPLFISLLTLRN